MAISRDDDQGDEDGSERAARGPGKAGQKAREAAGALVKRTLWALGGVLGCAAVSLFLAGDSRLAKEVWAGKMGTYDPFKLGDQILRIPGVAGFVAVMIVIAVLLLSVGWLLSAPLQAWNIYRQLHAKRAKELAWLASRP